jgi:putative peptidoglycan lipid II flippase
VIPAAVGLYLLAEPLVALCFERGAFTSTDTAETANILRGYAFAVIGICLYRVILPIFFALKDPWTPMKMSLIVMAIKIPVAMALLQALGLIGLPLSHAVTVTLEVTVLMAILGRKTGGWRAGLWLEVFRIVIAASFMGVTVFALDGLLPPMGHLRVLLLCLLGATVYAVFAFVLQVRSLTPILQRLTRRLHKKRAP